MADTGRSVLRVPYAAGIVRQCLRQPIKPTFRLPLCRSRFIIRAMFSKLLQLELTLLNPLLA